MVNEAIILAGGFGSRLKGSIDKIPKPMAPVNNKPFIEYILDHLISHNIKRIILSTGYMSEIIENHFGQNYRDAEIYYSVESKPLGTGGAIKKALEIAKYDHILVLNGDTLFKINIHDFCEKYTRDNADMSIALRKVNDTSRYGTVVTDHNNRIKKFSEKIPEEKTQMINGGIYIIRKKSFLSQALPSSFSLENDLMINLPKGKVFTAYPFEDYFIDIGTPSDYERAQNDPDLIS